MHFTTLSLLSKHLLDLADLSLNFASYLFNGTFSFQLRIVAMFADSISMPLTTVVTFSMMTSTTFMTTTTAEPVIHRNQETTCQ
jgi:hypothetical protein